MIIEKHIIAAIKSKGRKYFKCIIDDQGGIYDNCDLYITDLSKSFKLGSIVKLNASIEIYKRHRKYPPKFFYDVLEIVHINNFESDDLINFYNRAIRNEYLCKKTKHYIESLFLMNDIDGYIGENTTTFIL